MGRKERLDRKAGTEGQSGKKKKYIPELEMG